MSTIRIAVDVGGTFTDIQVLRVDSGATYSLKTPTTPADPGEGIVAGLQSAATRFDFRMGDVDTLIHGTTIATNAVLERKLARGALVTTAGFEDVLEIGRHVRKDIYAAIAEPRTLLIPRDLRLGVTERTRADGAIETPLAETAVAQLTERLRALELDAIAICLLHAYANPRHEIQLAEALDNALPDMQICTSHAVSPEIREFERTSTTVLNALLMPVVGRYLARLESRLDAAGIQARLYLFQSNGGVLAPLEAARLPVRLLLSGPAGGALGVQTLGRFADHQNLVGMDMGGTSFDVCVVEQDKIREVAQGEVADCPVRVPMLEIRTISAGGGSIARVDTAGRALVGPDSAGARPGPACYGHGGQAATVTDANVILGKLDPDAFLDGSMQLDADASHQVIRNTVASALSLNDEAAAAGVLDVAVAQMAAAIRLSLFEKGLDPRDFTLMSFGGASGLHAADVANELGANRVLYPLDAATLSAWGMLYADVAQDYAVTRLTPALPESAATLAHLVAPLVERATEALHGQGFSETTMSLHLSADMRYRGQAYEIAVPWESAHISPATIEAAVRQFHALHLAQFAHADESAIPEILTMRLRGIGELRHPSQPLGDSPARKTDAAHGARNVWLQGSRRTVPVLTRQDLSAAVSGPVVVEDPHTTIYIPSGWAIATGPAACLVAEKEATRGE